MPRLVLIPLNEPIQAISQARCVIFDFDGVIADSEEFQLGVWTELIAQRGLAPTNCAVQSIAGMIDSVALKNLCPGLSDREYEELLAEKARRCADRVDELTCVPGIAQVLTAWQAKKRLFICSSSSAEHIRVFLARHLGQIGVEAIIGAGQYSHPKPHPDPYLTVLEHAGIEPRHAVAIEDSPTGVKAARAAGIAVIHFDRYGLDLDGVTRVRSLTELVPSR